MSRIINGYVINNSRQPVAGVRVEAWIKDSSAASPLLSATTDAKGAFIFTFDDQVYREIMIARKQAIYFKVFSAEQLLADTADTLVWQDGQETDKIIITAAKDLQAAVYTITGTVTTQSGAPVTTAWVTAYDKRIDNDVLLGEAKTDRKGTYQVQYTSDRLAGKEQPDIEVRVQDANQKELGRSPISYNAATAAVVDVIISGAASTQSEYEQLVQSLQANTGRIKLSELQETKDKQQITLLANKTGWDARMVAMAVQAQKMGEENGIQPAHYYALFRSGLPASADAISKLAPDATVDMLKKATDSAIIPQSSIDDTVKNLRSKSADYLLKTVPENAVSSLGTMLSLRLNTDQQKTFVSILQDAGGDTAKVWSALKDKGFKPDTINSLQLDGKLGYLTGQNAPLINRLYTSLQVSNTTDLVSKQLYKADTWKNVIGQDVPKDIKPDDYARHLANQVKITYPTAVVAEMMNRDEIALDSTTPKQELYRFFNNNNEKFTIGQQPVKTWAGFRELSASAQASAKTMERLYQLSPSDEAMIALSKTGLQSAFDVTAYTRSEFMQKHGAGFPDVEQANLTYTKAVEVKSAVVNLATTYLTSRASPNVYAISGKTAKAPNEIIAYPTLEELFGNMDYCACDQCKSVLSAAAYLVELLQFIDLGAIPHDKQNPIEILKKRRPDIQHIQLSCENTNTILPYIDLVNEILEYYVVNGNLTNFRGLDITEDIRTEDLLANPQFIDETAYEELKTKVYPYGLPFDQPLEALRLLFGAWDTSLHEALAIYGDALSARKEILNLNAEEYAILTDINAHQLPEYFGEAPATTIAALNAAISNGKTFSRRVNITYEELVQLLKTSFINPGVVLVPKLEKLQISLADLQSYYTGAITEAQMDARIPATIKPEDYNGNVKQWLKDNQALIMGMILLTDTGSANSECNFAEVQLRYALPNNTNNTLTAVSYHKLHRFIRLWKKTGWKIDTLDKVITTFLPVPAATLDTTNIDQAFVTLLNRMANFSKLLTHYSLSEKKLPDQLLIWDTTRQQVFRQEQVARLLKMRVADMLDLAAIAGLDPLVNDLENDTPSLWQLVTLSEQLKDTGVKIADLNYLLRHKDDTGKLTLLPETLLKNMKLLRDGLTAVEKEHSMAPDNPDYTFAKSKMALVYDAKITDDFFGLITDSKGYGATLNTTEEGLPQKLTAANNRLGYDPFKKLLTFNGMLTAAAATDLSTVADSLVLADVTVITQQTDLDTFKTAIKNALQQIVVSGNNDLDNLAAAYPELKTIYDAVKAEPIPSAQIKIVLDGILPELKTRLKNIVLRQTLTGLLKTEAEITDVLTSAKEVLQASGDATKPVLFDFMNLEEKLTFNQNQVYRFYIDVPATDDYLVYVTAPQNTTINLVMNGQTIISGNTGVTGEIKNAAALALKAGQLQYAELTLAALPAGAAAQLGWQTKGMAKTIIPADKRYAKEQTDYAGTSFIRLQKAVQLQQVINLTARELTHFAVQNPETKNVLNELPADATITPVALKALWDKMALLVYFAGIKKENEPEENNWVQVLEDPAAKTPQGKNLLESINYWKDQDVTDVLTHYGIARNDLSALSVLKKLMRAMNLVTTIAYPATAVIAWSVSNPTVPLIAAIKNAIRRNTEETAWLEFMQRVNDPLRNLQRDALVSYILYHKTPSPEINTPDKLYEYFLIDVEMDACMKTSRIKQAISTVQLFIQRCLMNLEPEVAPGSIRDQQWQWMKRYRVWEANRKVFLYPENWLEPELRDNKSSFFRELEGELMQADINDELAETAYLNYLKKLDDVARLEIAGMCLEENEKGNQDDDILHVFGRTMGNTRHYYYRRYEYGYWTPWEKVSLQVEGEHLFPIVWKKRLFLFWLNIAEKPAPADRNVKPQDMAGQSWGTHAKINVEINMCFGEYYKGKWTSPKSMELANPIKLGPLSAPERKRITLYGRTLKKPNTSERLLFMLYYMTDSGNINYIKQLTYTSKNAPPVFDYATEEYEVFDIAFLVMKHNETLFRKGYSAITDSALNFNNIYVSESKDLTMAIEQPKNASTKVINEKLFSKSNEASYGFTVLPINHLTEKRWNAPFIYADERSTFFVQGAEELYVPFSRYDGYFNAEAFTKSVVEIPPLQERPVQKWPPEEMIRDVEDYVSNPATYTDQFRAKNNNYSKVLTASTTFAFGDALFGPTGKIADTVKTRL